ncbi:Uncharacterised protein [uncultured archaeon]|nr:Uncharacterised protein [uncultured archaeon]
MVNFLEEREMYKPKIYLISIFLGMILLFYSILEIKPVDVNIDDFLGLFSHLTISYIVGFIFVVICSIKLYFDNDLKKDSIYLTYLIVIGLFLFGIPIFAEDNARFAWSYYPSGEVKSILDVNKINSFSGHEMGAYYSWPGGHLISTFIIYATNIKIENMIKYMPLFWMLSVIFISYSAGKLFKLEGNQCFLIALLTISSFWTFNYYYGPPSLGYILYLLSFISVIFIFSRIDMYEDEMDKSNLDRNLFVKKETDRNKNLNNNDKYIDSTVMFLSFFVTVITHMLTSMALILTFLFSSGDIYKNRIKITAFMITIFLGWNFYAAPSMFDWGIRDFIKPIMDGTLFNIFTTEKYSSGTTFIREMIHYARISYLGFYAILIILAGIFYLKNSKNNDINRKKVKICFLWFFGILTLLVFRYGAEMDDRVYIMSLLPMSLILVMTFDKRIIATLAILFIALHIPAHYGTESYEMVQTTDLIGSEFLASKLNTNDSVNYYYAPLIRYYNNQFSNSMGFDNQGYFNPDNKSLKGSTYVIYSRQMHNYLSYVFGTDKTQNWLNTKNSPMLLYDNGNYNIFKNNKID